MELVVRLALVVSVAGLGVAVKQRTSGFDRGQLDAARASLAELAALETRLLQDKERLLGHQLHNVDPLAGDVRDLTAARERLEPLRQAAWLDPADRKLLAAKLDECKAELGAQEASIEELKSYTAFEHNSAENFPLFAEALAKNGPPALQEDVRKLHLLVADFLGGRTGKSQEILDAAGKLELSAKSQKAEVADELDWLAGHARIIVETEAKLFKHRAALEQPAAQRKIGLLQATFEQAAQAAAARTARGRNLLLALSGAVAALALACVAFWVRKRSRA